MGKHVGLTFENVVLSSESILALGDEAKSLFNKMVDLSILCISAEAVGVIQPHT